jgi:fibronectin-binding autotransporter adhesin
MSERMNCQSGRMNRGILRQMIRLGAAAAISFGGIGSAFAVAPTPAYTWDATGTSDYNILTNWDPDLTNVPTNTDNQFLTINNGATAAINGDSQGAFLILGLSTGQSGNLVINSGTSTFGEIRIGGRETVPDDYNSATPTYGPNNGGTGTVVQNPGTTVNVNYNSGTEPPVASFYVGDSSGLAGNTANGSYTINGTSDAPSVLLSGFATNDAIVIGTGTGTVGNFTQNAFTTVTSTGFVTVGRRGATGTYTMNGGTLNQQGTVGLVMGDGESVAGAPGTLGTFTQTGGDVNVTGAVEIGKRSGTGFYNMSGGTLNVTGGLIVGSVATTTAGLLDAHGTLNITPNLSAGPDPAITLAGGMNVVLGSATTATNGVGTVNMSAGSILFNSSTAVLGVGNGLGTNGSLNLSGGTITINGASAVIDVGRNSGSGTVTISGTGNLVAKQLNLNSAATTGASRILNISGGTTNIGTFNNGSTGGTSITRSVNISGGNNTIGTTTAGLNVAFNISGGTNSFTTTNLSNTAGNPTTFNITGGTNNLNNLTTNLSTLFISGGTNTIASGAFPGTLTLNSNSTLRTANTISLASNISLGNVSVDVTDGSLSLTGPITSTAARTLSKIGPGTLNISGAQSHVSGSAITNNAGGGILNLNANGGSNLTVNANSGTTKFGVAETLKAISVGLSGGTLDLGANNASVGALSLAGSPQNYGLTYGSLASSAAIKSDVYFSGTGIVTVGTAGDYNHSGEVEAGDYLIWRKNSAAYGDSAGYNLWRQNFGNLAVPGSGSGFDSGNQAVPEPGTLLLALSAVLLACGNRARR